MQCITNTTINLRHSGLALPTRLVFEVSSVRALLGTRAIVIEVSVLLLDPSVEVQGIQGRFLTNQVIT
jgi:hypothetical protein